LSSAVSSFAHYSPKNALALPCKFILCLEGWHNFPGDLLHCRPATGGCQLGRIKRNIVDIALSVQLGKHVSVQGGCAMDKGRQPEKLAAVVHDPLNSNAKKL
jgi:hypothetical protein